MSATIKELLPGLDEKQRIELGNYIADNNTIWGIEWEELNEVKKEYVREDGNRVRTYPEDDHDWITIQAAKLFGNEN